MLLKNRAFRFLFNAVKLGFYMVIGSMSLCLVSCEKETPQVEFVKVGILCSQTGPMSMQDRPVMEAILLAIDEINASGGLLGQLLKVVTFDGASDPENYIEGARELIVREKVVVLFGCGNSVSRRNVRPIVEEHENMLIYPMHYEGGGLSSNIVYVGPAPNQQVIPGVVWAMQNLGRRFFLVGTDAIYSHVVNAIIKDLIYALNGEVIGESYVPVDSNLGIDAIVERINAARPDVILNTIEGMGNLNFFKLLRQAGINPNIIPTMSFGLTETLLRNLSGVYMEGDYSVWGYFQSVESKANEEFEQKFYDKYGKGRVIDDPMESIYAGINIWAQAVSEAGSFGADQVLKNIENQSYSAPSGLIYMDPDTHGAYRPVRIGVIQADSQKPYKIVWDSEMSILPVQYTVFRSPQEWDDLIKDLYEKWGRQWFRGKE